MAEFITLTIYDLDNPDNKTALIRININTISRYYDSSNRDASVIIFANGTVIDVHETSEMIDRSILHVSSIQSRHTNHPVL